MQRLIWLMLLTGLIFNCAGEANNSTQEEKTDTNATEEPTASVKEVNTPTDLVLNPNLASKEELTALSQIDEGLAQQILDNRPFLNIKDFHQVLAGALDENTMKTFLTACFVPVNLNTTPEKDFLMVPGVGEKMAHEFEEYRPYKNIAQFRREMGKYVDDDEIARYEKYVFVPIALNSASDEEILAIPFPALEIVCSTNLKNIVPLKI